MEGAEVKVWLPRLTKYEKARIVGARALQISMGAPILLPFPPEGASPLEVAAMEMEMGLLPMIVKRQLPDGRYQDIPLAWLIKSRGKPPRREGGE
ncbi:MAG: DNA-directed RNA polymerase subunit K [Candidatus Nezhaarchaeota archaeon]|nr:DNA-directed RNA polymerase subunit K [Candidatus Nezhaarchaeota archaeon]